MSEALLPLARQNFKNNLFLFCLRLAYLVLLCVNALNVTLLACYVLKVDTSLTFQKFYHLLTNLAPSILSWIVTLV